MSDEPKATWTAREIVLELFPATNERLVPSTRNYRLEEVDDGQALIRGAGGAVVAWLSAVPTSGNPTGELCCDLCQRTGTRRWLGLFRAELPGSSGRRLRYLTACRDHRACEERRLDDAGIEQLLRFDS